MPIRIITLSDVRLFRDGLANLLQHHGEFEVIGTAGGIGAATVLLHERPIDVALLDMAMPYSLACVRGLADSFPSVKIVAVAVPDTETDIIACAEAGISGYVSCDASVSELIEAIKAAADGELRCPPRIAASLLRRVGRLASMARSPDVPPLTPRERDVVRLLELGRSNKEIARILGIELATAKNHVHKILEKLGTHRRAEAVAMMSRRLLNRSPETRVNIAGPTRTADGRSELSTESSNRG